ncbi:MAG: response regulator [Bacteroidota bacterium]
MKKIFIADDDSDILEVLKIMLQIKGYEVEATSNANENFISNAAKADLVILDLWMSGIDGRTVCKALRAAEQTKHIPIIFMSANSSLKEIAKEYNVDYIEKPFEMSYLLNKVQRLTTGKVEFPSI